MVSISIFHGDVRARDCDILILKHADGFYGVDDYVASKIDFTEPVRAGTFGVAGGRGTKAKKIVFVGVGPLSEFDYVAIRQFGQRSLEIAQSIDGKAKKICMPIHGPGYGLDENEAFSSLIAGLVDGLAAGKYPSELREIEIVEIRDNRAKRFRDLLAELIQLDSNKLNYGARGAHARGDIGPGLAKALVTFGAESSNKTRLFVAMPFKEEFIDEWEISIQEAAHSNEVLCERIDKLAFVGDIISEIRRRIEDYDGLIALLNEANPNVYLEIGYAWAKDKPSILIAKTDQPLPFDVKGQRCILYKGIADLRTKLTKELAELKSAGVFRKR